MRRPEREDPRIVDQNIDMAVPELDGSSGHFPRARRVSKIRRNKIRFASCRTDFRNRLLAAFRIAAYDYDMDAKLASLLAAARPIPLVPPVMSAVDELVAIFNSPLRFWY